MEAARGVERGAEPFLLTSPHSSLTEITRTLQNQPKN